MFHLLHKLAIKFLVYDLKRQKIDNLEIVIRSDGKTTYKRNKEKEDSIKKILNKIR